MEQLFSQGSFLQIGNRSGQFGLQGSATGCTLGPGCPGEETLELRGKVTCQR